METQNGIGAEAPQQIQIFDTTLRDGEQAPGFSMGKDEKVKIAEALADAGVDVIEAGFPIASEGDFEGVRAVADQIGAVREIVICALARALPKDIMRAGDAVRNARHSRIHTFMGTTDTRLEAQYNHMPREKALQKIREAVRLAKDNAEQVEFSAEDATRTDIEFLYEVYDAAVEEGATRLNIPDTVAFADFYEYGELIADLVERYGKGIIISTHCHNDFGLATANTWAGIINGARQAHVTINGIGERAGNASMQEISNLIAIKGKDGLKMNFNRSHNCRLSRTLTRITGITPQPNCPIVGANAFAHESGIHQDGALKNRTIYEVVSPEDNGYDDIDSLVLGKHCGQAAVREKTRCMGIFLDEAQIRKLTDQIKAWSDANPRKRGIGTEELQVMIAQDPELQTEGTYRFIHYTSKKNGGHDVNVTVSAQDEHITKESSASGAIDAGISAIKQIPGLADYHFDRYLVHATGPDQSATALVSMDVFRESAPDDRIKTYASGTDTIAATLRCFLDGVNRLLNREKHLSSKTEAH